MKNLVWILALVVWLSGICLKADNDGENEKKIKLDKVPPKVLAAAKKKLKDFKPVEAEVEEGKKYTEYELEGTAKGKKYEVEVKVDKKGKIIKVEVEEDKDDDDDDEV